MEHAPDSPVRDSIPTIGGNSPRNPPASGFSLVEVLLAVVVFGIIASVGWMGLTQYREASAVRQAAESVAGDVAMTRAYAVQRSETVVLDADEAARSYEIRTASGTVLASRSYAAGTDMPLTLLEVPGADDSIVFDSRGLLTPPGTRSIVVGRFADSLTVRMNTVGRTRIEAP